MHTVDVFIYVAYKIYTYEHSEHVYIHVAYNIHTYEHKEHVYIHVAYRVYTYAYKEHVYIHVAHNIHMCTVYVYIILTYIFVKIYGVPPASPRFFPKFRRTRANIQNRCD